MAKLKDRSKIRCF